jgi:regulator of replication initiation timing
MKQTIALILLMILFAGIGCSTKPQEKGQDEVSEKSLYDQVMDIHDEVMPSMGELNRLKRELKDKVENSPNLVEEKRKEIEETILTIESASKSMMVWMREFNPEDYQGEELTKYLQSEKKRVQQVKETMLDAIVKGRKVNE